MHPMHGVRKELSQRRIMTTSSLSITGDIEGISLHIANDLLLFIFIRVVHSGLPFVIQNGDNQGICKKRHGRRNLRYCKHRLTRAHREKQLKMSCQALHNAPPNRT